MAIERLRYWDTDGILKVGPLWLRASSTADAIKVTNHCQSPPSSSLALPSAHGWRGCGAYQVPPSAGDVITFICDTQISNLLCQLPRLPRLLLSHNYCLVTHRYGGCHLPRPSLYKSLAVSRWEQEQEQEREKAVAAQPQSMSALRTASVTLAV